jgi:hypothetical protein
MRATVGRVGLVLGEGAALKPSCGPAPLPAIWTAPTLPPLTWSADQGRTWSIPRPISARGDNYSPSWTSTRPPGRSSESGIPTASTPLPQSPGRRAGPAPQRRQRAGDPGLAQCLLCNALDSCAVLTCQTQDLPLRRSASQVLLRAPCRVRTWQTRPRKIARPASDRSSRPASAVGRPRRSWLLHLDDDGGNEGGERRVDSLARAGRVGKGTP